MERKRSRPRTKTGRRAARIIAGLGGLFVVALLAVWWHLASDDPQVAVPMPIMPNPNAFDYYVAAANGLVNSGPIDDATSPLPKVARTLEQKETLVQQNAGALKSLHQGFVFEYRNPPARSFSALFPYLSNYRRVARLLLLQSQVRGARGDWSGAADSALDAMRVGEDVPRGGVVIAQLVGNSCEAIGQSALWKTVEHLNAAQSRAAIQRLEAIMDRHFSFADTLLEEKWMGQAGLKEQFHATTLRSALSDANSMAGGSSTSEISTYRRYSMAFYMLYGKKKVLANYGTLMDLSIAQARLPYQTKQKPLPSLDPITDEITPVFEGARFAEAKTRVHNVLLLTALALHAYHLEHGRYPTALAELAPAYLPSIPADPFALQGALAYRIEGEKYVLYSIGPDGKNDGGTPIDDPNRVGSSNPRARYRVDPDSHGDIVTGINTP